MLLSCGIGAGTHRSIKAYVYPVTKFELEKAVDSVLENDITVKRKISYYYYWYDSIKKVAWEAIDSTVCSTKVFDSAYNDGKRYLTINIVEDAKLYRYSFQYSGTDADWDSSKNSEISIAYAWDDKGNGGSEGHGDFNGKIGIKKKLTDRFENEFLNKVDKRLGKSHAVSD